MVTRKDIAREAGVSYGTVSNVLNKTGKVSIEKIRLVEEAVKRLGYVPNTQAQLLRQGAATTIAVILPSLHEDAYLDLYTALQSILGQNGYTVVVYTTEDVANKETDVLENLQVSSLAAVITVSCMSASCCERYQGLPCPVLYMDRRPPELREGDAFFAFDFRVAGAELGRELIRHKCRNAVFFGSSSGVSSEQTLLCALEDEVLSHEISVHTFFSDCTMTLNKAFQIVQSSAPFDAIITSGTVRAEAICSVLQLCHYEKRPKLLSIGSFRPFHPAGIDVYELDYHQMGARIAKHLVEHLQKKEPLLTENILPAKGFPYRFPMLRKAEPQILTLLTLDTPSTSALNLLLPMFEAISGITVKTICVPYEDLHAQLNLMSPSFSYDLIRMDVAKFDSLGEQTYLPMKEAGISEQLLSHRLIHSAYSHYSYLNGKMYTLPFDPSVQLLLYRRDLFEDATIRRAFYERYHEQLTIPQTIGQYLRAAEFFTQSSNPDSPTKYGATMTNGSAATAASDFLPYYMEKIAGHPTGAESVCLNSPEMVEAMRQYQAMIPFSCQQQWWSSNIQQFADGMTAMTVIYSNYIANLLSATHSSVVGKVGATIVPGGRPLLGGGVVGISRYCKKLDACKQFFSWYYSSDIASMIVRLGGTSPLADTYNDFLSVHDLPWLTAAEESFSLGVRGASEHDIPGFSIQKYEFAVGTAVKNLTSGIMPPEAAAEMAQALYDGA